MIAYADPKILKADDTCVQIKIPLKRRTKNHLGSMYFGALSVGADFSAGLLVLNLIRKYKSKANLVFKDFTANFIKRATSDVVFICQDADIVRQSVLENVKNGRRVNFKLSVKAYCRDELVGDFILTTSIK